jgi:hypothetical protein
MPSNGSEKHVISSRDGTSIAYWQSGEGPPLLLVHGATGGDLLGQRRAVADDEQPVPRLLQVPGHRPAHDPEPDECESLRHDAD